MAADARTKYLQQLGHSWYVRIKVPPALQKLVGNTHIRKALHTRSLDEANVLKWPAIARIKRELEQLKRSDPEGTKAQLYRDQITEARNAGDSLSAETLELLAVDDAEKLHEATGSLEKARAWYQLATTDGKSLTQLLDDWLDSSEYKAHTKDKHKKAFEEFKTFMGGDCLPSAVTDKVALDYVDIVSEPTEALQWAQANDPKAFSEALTRLVFGGDTVGLKALAARFMRSTMPEDATLNAAGFPTKVEADGTRMVRVQGAWMPLNTAVKNGWL